MHCCRLSHPSVYKVGKMSSTLNVHGGGMQRWCSSNNADREHLNARRVRLYLWYLLISTIFSYYTLPPLNLQAHFFGAILSVLLKFRENPFTEMRRKKNGGMPGCLSVFFLRLWKCFWHLAPCNLTVAYQHKHQEFGLCGVIWPEILRKEKLWSGHLPEKENSPCLLYKRKLEDKEMHIFSIAKRGAVQLNTLQIHRICTHMHPQMSTQPQSGVTLWETECR